jgi:membrane carboxypeptidase/penicillin-binding protein
LSFDDITLAEAAVLAGIPKNPERYNPRGDLRAVKTRQEYVLTQMVELGFVDKTTTAAAATEPHHTSARGCALSFLSAARMKRAELPQVAGRFVK